MNKKPIYLLLVFLCLVLLGGIVAAQVSTNYSARWSRLAGGGGYRQANTTAVQDVLGQWVYGQTNSHNHEIVSGFYGPDTVIIFTNEVYMPVMNQP